MAQLWGVHHVAGSSCGSTREKRHLVQRKRPSVPPPRVNRGVYGVIVRLWERGGEGATGSRTHGQAQTLGCANGGVHGGVDGGMNIVVNGCLNGGVDRGVNGGVIEVCVEDSCHTWIIMWLNPRNEALNPEKKAIGPSSAWMVRNACVIDM